MSTITLRSVKGSPLTNAEIDANFTNLNNDKLEASALSPYLLSSTAASTYQTQAGMSSYLTASSAASTYATISNPSHSGNLTFTGGSNRITGDFTGNSGISTRVLVQTNVANGNTYWGVIPNGTATNSQLHVFGASDPTNAPFGTLTINSTQVRLQSTASGTGTALPLAFLMSSTEVARISTGNNFLIGTVTDNGTDKLQVSGSVNASGGFVGNVTGNVSGSAGSVAWTGVSGRPTALSSFTNDSGYITSSALSTYAPLASPGLTGTPTAPTATANTNTTQIATTAFVLGQGNSTAATIAMNGTQAAGTSNLYARADHVHPSDTTRVSAGVATNFTAQQYFGTQTLTDGATISWAVNTQQVAKVTLGGNRTMAAPTGLVDGAFYNLAVYQDATGSRTLTWNSVFKFTAGTAPTLSTAANAKDFFTFKSDGTNLYEQGRSQAVA